MDLTERALRNRLRVFASQMEQRDELVRMAHAAGITKTDIHRITGLARTTIDRICAPLISEDARPASPPLVPPAGGPGPQQEGPG